MQVAIINNERKANILCWDVFLKEYGIEMFCFQKAELQDSNIYEQAKKLLSKTRDGLDINDLEDLKNNSIVKTGYKKGSDYIVIYKYKDNYYGGVTESDNEFSFAENDLIVDVEKNINQLIFFR